MVYLGKYQIGNERDKTQMKYSNTQLNILKLMGKKIFTTLHTKFFCLSKPMESSSTSIL